jgi:hypothetical protein
LNIRLADGKTINMRFFQTPTSPEAALNRVQDDEEYGGSTYSIRVGQQAWNGVNQTDTYNAGKTYSTHFTITLSGTCAIGQAPAENSPLTDCSFWSLG